MIVLPRGNTIQKERIDMVGVGEVRDGIIYIYILIEDEGREYPRRIRVILR
tara:strand:+ start:185 stop:337 length:153 start_codon:yes stop_codon:yes gene_type:complete